MPGFIKWVRDDNGATSVEYAVMLALILMVVITGIASLGGEAHSLWGWIEERIEAFF